MTGDVQAQLAELFIALESTVPAEARFAESVTFWCYQLLIGVEPSQLAELRPSPPPPTGSSAAHGRASGASTPDRQRRSLHRQAVHPLQRRRRRAGVPSVGGEGTCWGAAMGSLAWSTDSLGQPTSLHPSRLWPSTWLRVRRASCGSPTNSTARSTTRHHSGEMVDQASPPRSTRQSEPASANADPNDPGGPDGSGVGRRDTS
jgi:hypothetical protein